MPILPGAPATFTITLVDTDRFTPLPGCNVELRQFDPAIGTYKPLQKGVTDALGKASFSAALPGAVGTFRYVAFFGGTPELEPSTSPETRVEIALPK